MAEGAKYPATLDQRWAQRAFERVQRRKGEKEAEYKSFASSFPTMIHSCGLAQALAFAQAKGNDKHKAPKDLLDDLEYVLEDEGENLPYKSINSGLTEYLLLSRHALTAAGWIKRYASALLKEKEEGSKDEGD